MATNDQNHSRTPDSSYQQALAFLYDRINYERIAEPAGRFKFRLQRIRELMRQLGLSDYLYNPQDTRPKVPLVHIAGTKGKGSTAAMVAAALTAAGLKTGLYTSPHLHQLEERFRIDGVLCSQQEIVHLVQRIAPATKAVERQLGPTSFFELTTTLALLHFDSANCDAIVLEVGLGGRLDSTNVCAPSVSVITSIGLDHQHVLGNTLVEIAAEKAGIIKPGVPVISGVADSGAAEVVAQVASRNQCDLFALGKDFDFESTSAPAWGSELIYSGRRAPLTKQLHVNIPMEGDHQSRNGAIAIAALDLLRDQGVSIPIPMVQQGIGQLTCIARIERFLLPENVTVIVDAAHNDDSIAALCQTLARRFTDHPMVIVFGTSIDKNAETMLQTLNTITDQFVLTRFWRNPRFRPPQDLVPLLPESLKRNTKVFEDPIEACQTALRQVTPGGTLVVCGSFFLAAETREWFLKQQKSGSLVPHQESPASRKM